MRRALKIGICAGWLLIVLLSMTQSVVSSFTKGNLATFGVDRQNDEKSRDRLYGYSMPDDGSDAALTDYQWMGSQHSMVRYTRSLPSFRGSSSAGWYMSSSASFHHRCHLLSSYGGVWLPGNVSFGKRYYVFALRHILC